MSADPSLDHLVDEWKFDHTTRSGGASRTPARDRFRDNLASLPNVSRWPRAVWSL